MRSGRAAVFFTAAIIVGLDLLTKTLIREQVAKGDSIPVLPGVLHVTHVTNTGGAFGVFAGYSWLFICMVAVVCLAAALYVLVAGGRLPAALGLGVGLAFGGAGGNLIDRVVRGCVTDFLDIRVWPVFNLADMAIVSGACLLGWYALGWARKDREEA